MEINLELIIGWVEKAGIAGTVLMTIVWWLERQERKESLGACQERINALMERQNILTDQITKIATDATVATQRLYDLLTTHPTRK